MFFIKQKVMAPKFPSYIRFLFLISSLFLFTYSAAVHAAENGAPEPPPSPAAAEENARISAEFEKIRTYAETGLISEKENISQLQNQLADIEKLAKSVENEMNLYEIQLSNHSNLLLQPETRIDALIKAQSQHHTALKKTLEYIHDMQAGLGLITRQQQQAADQYTLNMGQMAALTEGVPQELQNGDLIKDLKSLTALIEQKQDLLQRIRNLHEKMSDHLLKNRKHLTVFSGKIEKIIAEKKKKSLFLREKNSIHALNAGEMKKEFFGLPGQIMQALSDAYRQMTASGFFPFIAPLFLLLLFEFILFRFRFYCYSFAQRHHLADYYPWRNFVLLFFCESLPLGGAAFFTAVYAQVRNLNTYLSVFNMIIAVLYVCLWTRWGLDFLRLWNTLRSNKIPASLQQHLNHLLRLIRFFMTVIILLIWVNGSESTLLLPLRIFFYLVLLISCLTFWREYRKHFPLSENRNIRKFLGHRMTAGLSYSIPFGSIFMEIAGFGNMANFWFASWSLTSVGLLWTWILFYLLREWGEKFKDTSLVTSTEKKNRRPLQWLGIQFSWLLWIQFLFFILSFAWHPDKTVIISSYFDFLRMPLPVANFNITILGIFYTVIALLITHAAVRIWRMLLGKKVLVHSGFDSGLKNSIIVVSSYLLWFMGILVILNILGVEGQSLAVAFGGLGIGLGFGLQAIFNNFISGIIMLFERPIQVGDVVEVNNIWGEVKKINVRSTVVKTYDYATLIIPNSEMISNQLTNWTFQDNRIRRNVYVGVSYSSNVELVRDTLLEIVRAMHTVLKYPAPDVLFKDFGDSSLLFHLRYYTDVDDGLSTDSLVRFEIIRLFRERNIEIPFPQRDLHLRSADSPPRGNAEKNFPSARKADDSPDSSPDFFQILPEKPAG